MDKRKISTNDVLNGKLKVLSRDALHIYREALNEMDPGRLVHKTVKYEEGLLQVGNRDFEIKPGRHIWVLGTGKAAGTMGRALEEVLGSALGGGVVIDPEGYEQRGHVLTFCKGGHPLPDQGSVASARRLVYLASDIPAGDVVIYALSGGSSALFEIPAGRLELEDIRETTDLLLNSGALIHEINVVRKHLSAVKGGQLLRKLAHTRVIDLVISDVPGDDLQSIGSAPTQPDPSTYKEAYQILKRYRILQKVSGAVRIHIGGGMEGQIPETPKPGFDEEMEHHTLLIGSARKLAERAAKIAQARDYQTWVSNRSYKEDVENVASDIVRKVKTVMGKAKPVGRPAALFFFGESTVQVKGSGRGGRNQEMAVRIARHLDGHHPVAVLSCGTDGRDGPTDAAGGLVTSATLGQARGQRLDIDHYLSDNNTYPFLQELGALIKTGPTGNNLMDFQLVLVGK